MSNEYEEYERNEIVEQNHECEICGAYVDKVGDRLCSRCEQTDG